MLPDIELISSALSMSMRISTPEESLTKELLFTGRVPTTFGDTVAVASVLHAHGVLPV